MTIVDTHTHMPGKAFSMIEGYDSENFINLLNNNGIDKAWVFTLDGLYFDPAPHNDHLLDYCSIDPQRLIPFCTVHPRYSNVIDELRRCIVNLGMRGVKLHPWAQTFSPLEPMMDKLGEELESLKVPVVFHDGTPPYSSPLQIAYFALRHPKLKVILGHGGLHDLWKEALFAAERCKNIFIIPSGTPPHGLKQMISRLSIEKFLFGTDAGFGDPYWLPFQINKLKNLKLSSSDEKMVFGENAERILSGN
ncbi:MAG: amidohydrolase family protein [Anaerolineaceae bacterium]|nr:amidohydrolase family protein [Anaerolineaceae bacterium]